MKTNILFNRENLFICRSKKLIDGYFSSVFPWLKKCEIIFGQKKTNIIHIKTNVITKFLNACDGLDNRTIVVDLPNIV